MHHFDCLDFPIYIAPVQVNTLRPRQNGRRFADDTFKRIFLIEMLECRLRFHWNLFLRVQLTALVQKLAWRRPGDKPLSEPMLVCLLTHICVTRPQWVKWHWWTWLTHWSWDKMAAIFQTTFSDTFSWMKMYEFCLRFHWSLLLGVQLTIFQHWFR